MKPYSCPEGYSLAAVQPVVGFEDPETPILTEPLSRSRNLATLLSYNRRRLSMLGVQPGETFNYGTITTKPHGTHLTFDNRKRAGAAEYRCASDLPADRLVGKLAVIDLSASVGPRQEIGVDHLAPHEEAIRAAKVVFLRTDYSRRHRRQEPTLEYYLDSPTLQPAAATWLAERGVGVVGADVRTLDPRYAGRPAAESVHELLNAAGIVVVEDLANLDQLTSQHDYAIIGLPLGIRGVTGGPARVFAINRQDPTTFVDCTHELEYYPDRVTDEIPFVPPETTLESLQDIGDYPNPIPGRIDPRELQEQVARQTRLTPFNIYHPELGVIGQEMYIQYGHSTTTHIEAAFFDPWGRHYVPDEIMRRYVRMPAEKLIGPAVLVDLGDMVGPGQQIDAGHLKAADPGVQEGDIVFIRTDITDWYYYGSDVNIGITPGLSPDAAHWLVDKGIRSLVLDSPSVERSDPISASGVRHTSNKIHYLLHRNDIPLVEWGVRFHHLRKDRFIAAIMALPVSHQGCFPAHLIAIEEWD